MPSAYKKILVTGGAGFIGSHLIPLLIHKGYSVKVFDNLFSGKLENLTAVLDHPNFQFVKGDIRDATACNTP
jgi:nucleoside-diphosphate-sugar epimerase